MKCRLRKSLPLDLIELNAVTNEKKKLNNNIEASMENDLLY